LAASAPEPQILKIVTVFSLQAQPLDLTTHRCGDAMDSGVPIQAHHIGPTGPVVEPAQQLRIEDSAIHQQGNSPKVSQD
jgi:hypothetical protein